MKEALNNQMDKTSWLVVVSQPMLLATPALTGRHLNRTTGGDGGCV